MAISLVGFGAAQTGVGGAADNNLTCPIPAHQAGDLIVLLGAARTSVSFTAPAGYSDLITSALSVRCRAVAKVGDGTDSSVVLDWVGGTANDDIFGQVAVFRGTVADATQVLDATGVVSSNASAQDITYPSYTVVNDNCAVIMLAKKTDDASAWSTPANFTVGSQTLNMTTGADMSAGWFYWLQSSKSSISTSTITATGGGSQTSTAVIFALKAAGVAKSSMRGGMNHMGGFFAG